MKYVGPFLRSEWRQHKGLLILSLTSLLLGQLGILQLESLGSLILAAQKSNAKNLLGGDLKITSKVAFTPEKKQKLLTFLPEGSELAQDTATMTMARVAIKSGEKSRLLEVHFVSDNFPFYGEFRALDFKRQTQRPIAFAANAENSIQGPWGWIEGQGELLSQGQELHLGGLTLTVLGEITHNPQQDFQMGTLGPKIYLSEKFLEEAKLLQFGSLASYALIIRLPQFPANSQPFNQSAEFTQWLKAQDLRLSSPDNIGGRSDRVIKNLKDYIMLGNLISWTISLLGGFFFFLLYSQYLFSKLALYFVQGLSWRELRRLFCFHFLSLAGVTSLLGLAISVALSRLLFPLLLTNFSSAAALGSTSLLAQSWSGLVLKSFSIGPLFVLLLLPLFWSHFRRTGIREFLFGQKELTSFNPAWALWPPLFFYLGAMALWLTRSLLLSSAFLITLAVLLGFHWLLLKFILSAFGKLAGSNRLRLPNGMVLGILKLRRFQGQTLLLVTTLAFSLGLYFSLGNIEAGLKKYFQSSDPLRPDFFLVDIDPSQVDELKSFAATAGAKLYELSPMVKARPVKLNDKEIAALESQEIGARERERAERLSRHTLNLSYRAHLGLAETLVRGTPLSLAKVRGELIPISLEEGYAKRLGLDLDDTYELDILGMPLQTYVANIRQVRWTSFLPNFFAILAPGHLEGAPQSLIGVLKVSGFTTAQTDSFLNDANEKFPNINFLDMRRMLERLGELITLVETAIKILLIPFVLTSLFLFLVLILFSVKNNQQRQTLYAVLGASNSLIKSSWLSEYGLLFWLISGLALGEGYLLSKLLSNFIFDGIWKLNLVSGAGIVLGLLLLFSLPLAILRHQSRRLKFQARKMLED